ncbi:hypothetical protein EAY39_08170 [Vibrio anguillarum]|uniref:hypothetical protein n=2 Tax=Vibrio anguillarum TaxID=55601 RepID=UPI0018C20E8A|nr:hypothetical protein [Vibrio anguillarum]MBF4340764.1 hypothetical protein [Vibrio anguillarum]
MRHTNPDISDQSTVESMRSRFLSEPIVMDKFPIQLPGAGELSELNASCHHCGQVAERDHFRGVVTQAFGQVNVNAHAICTHCGTIYPIVVRYKVENGVFVSMYINRNGEWVRAEHRNNPSLVQRLFQFPLVVIAKITSFFS